MVGPGADQPRTAPDQREQVVDHGRHIVDHEAGSVRRETVQAPTPAHEAGRERLLEAIASLRHQNELQESRMPVRPAADVIARAEDVSRFGQAAAAAVRYVPNPAQVKDLAEHPEKAPLAAAKEVATKLGPIGAPVSKAVDGVAKQIERSSGADHDR